jgi:ammonia channel protein AmtB
MVVGMNGVTGQIVAGLVEEDYRPGTVFVKGLSMEDLTVMGQQMKSETVVLILVHVCSECLTCVFCHLLNIIRKSDIIFRRNQI